MRTQTDISNRLDIYKQQLAIAVEEKTFTGNEIHPDIDLIILSLIDKIEALFWVLEMELPDDDLLDRIATVNH